MRKLERLGKIEKSFLLLIQENNYELELSDFVALFNLHPSTCKRILNQLEIKGKIKLIDNNVYLLKEDYRFNFARHCNMKIFYQLLKTDRYFKVKDNIVYIDTPFVYYELLRSKIMYNKTLESLKQKDELKYNQMINSAFEQINYDLNLLSKKILTWSNSKYEIILVNENIKIHDIKHKMLKLRLINRKTKETLFLKEFERNNMREKKMLCECIQLIIKILKQIQVNINYLSYFDYAHL